MVQAQAWLPAQIQVLTAPERWGYKRICDYYNVLAAIGRRVVFLYNDDCTMLTPRWDEIIRSESPGILWPQAGLRDEPQHVPGLADCVDPAPGSRKP